MNERVRLRGVDGPAAAPRIRKSAAAASSMSVFNELLTPPVAPSSPPPASKEGGSSAEGRREGAGFAHERESEFGSERERSSPHAAERPTRRRTEGVKAREAEAPAQPLVQQQTPPPAALAQPVTVLREMSAVVEYAVLVRDVAGVHHLQLGVCTTGAAAQESYAVQLSALGGGKIALKVRGAAGAEREALEARRELARRLRERGLEVVEDEEGEA